MKREIFGVIIYELAAWKWKFDEWIKLFSNKLKSFPFEIFFSLPKITNDHKFLFSSSRS